MNLLFYYVGAMDTQEKGQYEQFMEFRKLEREIDLYENELLDACKPFYTDFTLALMRARAKSILRNLNIID